MRGYYRLLQSKTGATVDGILPEYADRDGSRILVKSQRGMGVMDAIVDRIGERVERTVRPVSNYVVGTVIAFLLLAVPLFLIGATGWSIVEIVSNWEVYFTAETSTASGETSPVNPLLIIPSLLAGVLLITGLFVTVSYGIFAAFSLPLAFHEFGHYLACRVSGVDVESWGIMFRGPAPMGAAIVPENMQQWRDLDLHNRLWVVSAGVFNDFIHAFTAIGLAIVFSQPLLYLYGGFIIWVAAFNCIPFGSRTDGALYVDALLQEWWGFRGAIRNI